MDNPVREFAEVVREQLNGLIHFNEIDHEIFELDFDGWEEHGGIQQWTRQDQRRLQHYLACQNASLSDPRSVYFEPGRTHTRVTLAFRFFKLESQVVRARQKACEFCSDKPQFSTVPAVVSAMSIAHRKWKQGMKLQHDEETMRELRQAWNDAFDDLFDWIDEIESYEDWAPKPEPVTDDFEEGWKAAEEAFNRRITEVLAQGKAIPTDKRTRPMSKTEAMNYIGWPKHVRNDRQARDWLNSSIELGNYRCEPTRSKKQFIFHIDDFPEETRREIKQR